MVRVLSYLGRLDNDVRYLDTLPPEVLERITIGLDAKALNLLCAVSRAFTWICSDPGTLRRVLRTKGHRGQMGYAHPTWRSIAPLSDVSRFDDPKTLRRLLALMEGKSVPGFGSIAPKPRAFASL